MDYSQKPFAERAWLEIPLEAEKIVLTISDTGTGIPKEDIDRIFDAFYSTKRSRFGMGLPLVKQIVSEHLGEIRVESWPEKGTTFKIIFPARWKEEKKNILTT